MLLKNEKDLIPLVIVLLHLKVNSQFWGMWFYCPLSLAPLSMECFYLWL